MNSPLVYLAGPITDCHYVECTDWRDYVTRHLDCELITSLSPMRAKEYLKGETSIAAAYPDSLLSCDRGIMSRDYFDVRRCDLLFVNFLGAGHVSIGTVMEIAWAYEMRKPIVAAMEIDDGSGDTASLNPHEHPMIREAIGFRAPDLDSAILLAKAILSP